MADRKPAVESSFCIYWYWYPPAPNKAVLILTGVTVVMALLDMRPRLKAVYLVLVIWVMGIENRAINRDRVEANRARGSQKRAAREVPNHCGRHQPNYRSQ